MHHLSPQQSKQKSTPNKTLQVDFSNLTQNNKSDFLEFLLKNNITFEKCDGKNMGSYIAKVTIMKNIINEKQKLSIKNKQKQKNITNKHQVYLSRSTHQPINNSFSLIKNIEKNKNKTPIKNCKQQFKNKPYIKYQNNKQIITRNQKQQRQNHKNYKYNNKLGKQFIDNSSIRSNSFKKKQDQSLYGPKSVRTTEFQPDDHSLCNSKQKYPKQNTKITNTKPFIQKNPVQKLPNPPTKRQSFPLPNDKPLSTTCHPILKKSQPKQRQKITQINNKIKQKTQLQKQITELVNRLLKLFQVKLQGQKLIKIPLNQLIRIIQNIYNWIFEKNNTHLEKKNLSKEEQLYRFGYQPANQNLFVKFVKQFFINKFNNQKQGISNLINMLYSLALYLEIQKKHQNQHHQISAKPPPKQLKAYFCITSTGIFIKTFQDFINNIYKFEDLLFYLFIRNIIINEIQSSATYNKIKIQQNHTKTNYINQIDIIFNMKDINKILKQILYEDNQLIKQYTDMILQHIKQLPDKQPSDQQQHLRICSPQFIALLLEDYKKKRITLQSEINQEKCQKNNSIDVCSFVEENTFEDMLKKGFSKYRDKQHHHRYTKSGSLRNDNDTNQLTFGQQTQDNIEQALPTSSYLDNPKQFWQANSDQKLSTNYESNPTKQLMFSKMKKKVKELVNILIENRSQYNSAEVQHQKILKQQTNNQSLLWIELLTRKSLSLLNNIMQMNKIQWFDDLRVSNPSQQDIDKVQSLQLTYRKIKDNPQPQQIAKLCKNVLTIPQLTSALEKLMNMSTENSHIF